MYSIGKQSPPANHFAPKELSLSMQCGSPGGIHVSAPLFVGFSSYEALVEYPSRDGYDATDFREKIKLFIAGLDPLC
ncbi:hypothetical protein LIER_07580 [Lithospermum erythrorhizon]|uniref:Uncharacterized protein n=1 Tax=Lithospermum erythrorhizon TaxID=34254 RepID=A0AAV3P8U5_LITER